MKNRIKKLRKSLNMTQQEFAERIGVKRNTIGQYEIGRNKPIDTVINLICKEFNVNEKWLRYGEDEMFHPEPTDVLDKLAEKYRLSNSDYIMIEKFVNLKPEVRQNIYNYFREVVSAFPYENIELQEQSVEELEEAYTNSRSDSVSKTTLSISSITNEKQKNA